MAKITIEKLAQMSQNEFTAIREEMKEGFETVKEDIKILRQDVESGFHAITETLKLIQADLKDLKKIDIEVMELKYRVERIEKHLRLNR